MMRTLDVEHKYLDVLLARQPIFDSSNNAFGFEMLYRGTRYDITNSRDSLGATSELISNLYATIQKGNLADNKPVFINADERFLESPVFFPSNPEGIVIEILETVHATPQVIENIQLMKSRGFKFALDDFTFESHQWELTPFADIIKIDLTALPYSDIQNQLPSLNKLNTVLLAEKVEDAKTFNQCLKDGFTLFQGYYLEKPELIHGVEIPTSKQVTLKLLSVLNKDDVTPEEISELVSCDPRLAVKIILLVNSSLFSFNREIKSVREAVIMMGVREIQKWLTILLLTSESESPLETFRVLLSRAKAMEKFAEEKGMCHPYDHFNLGLFSGLPALLSIDKNTLLENVTISAVVKDALNEQPNELFKNLQKIKSMEQGQESIHHIQIQELQTLNRAYWCGINWADDLMRELERL
ncbi:MULTISPECIES: EAL and HDOD domain-containing protein [Pseudoalteromonas]|uniref:EAL and HDOD domain-containing protein n=1 Tax=Pseudoalteromonas TaxID=53246 RepID=UPI00057AD99B|nr:MULTISPECIES: HDOD domain-containing protein [Pseudoalteromonas]ATG57152.1 hypothetical protein CPA52_02335 [Pseudoalteromonas marina]